VVTVTVERGGFGVESAAPIARDILERYFNTQSAGGVNAAAAARRGQADGSRQASFTHRPAPFRSPSGEPHRYRRRHAGSRVGLIAFSVFTLATSTCDEIAGRPLYSSSGRPLRVWDRAE